MSTTTVMRAPRKCSQCRQEGCNKGKATCPVNIERICPVVIPVDIPVVIPVVIPVKKRLCGECLREGCDSTNMMCLVKIEIERHCELAAQMQCLPTYSTDATSLQQRCNVYLLEAEMGRLPEPNNPTRHYQETVFNHIEDPVCRYKLSINLYYKIYLKVNKIMIDVRARNSQESTQQTSKVKLTVLPEYKMCSEKCGICYAKTCNVTLNCNHQVCVDCFKGNFRATKAKFNASLTCPFCRCVTETIQATDAKIRKALVKL
jgi:hypothetical protein